jgi:hypothetical protein
LRRYFHDRCTHPRMRTTDDLGMTDIEVAWAEIDAA